MRKFLCVILLIGLCLSLFSCAAPNSRSEEDSRNESRDKEDSNSGWAKWLNPTPTSAPTDPEPLAPPLVAPIPEGGDETVEGDIAGEGEFLFEKDFGSYRVPEGWEESESHSTDEKYFYVPRGNDDLEWTDNISVNIGSNKYSEEELDDFKEAIMEQYATQIDLEDTDGVVGFAYKTPQGYPVLVFTVTEIDGLITRQYYIVADHKFCLVHVTCKDDPEDAERTSKCIVESFIWAEE